MLPNNPSVVPEPWLSFLTELDQLATETVRLECIGGFVVTMLYGLGRTTGDLDVYEIAPRAIGRRFDEVAGKGAPLCHKYKVYLDYVAVVQPPYNYEDRLHEMFPGEFRHLRLMAFDPYDLALTKLARNIERDRSDVRHLAKFVPFELNVLRERYLTELRPYVTNPRREDQTLELWIDDIEEIRERSPQTLIRP
jgi:Nucleotidyltransferase of unknown function (DUF6036)